MFETEKAQHMKFSVNKTELQNALAVAQKGVSTRSTLPVLSGILITAQADQINFQSTDLELSIQMSVPALIEEEGRTVVPGKLFSDIIKNLPDAAIHVSTSESEAQISCGNSAFSIKTLAAEDFPGFPKVTPNQTIKLPFATFADMVHRVARAVSRDETRAILTGILVEMDGATLRMVATDSYRMAISEAVLEEGAQADDSFSAVIGGRFMNDVAGLAVNEDLVTIGIAENQIIITCDNMMFINRRIEGTYPNYQQLLSNNETTRAKFDVAELSASVRRASLMSSSTAPIRFMLDKDVNLVQITVTSADIGSVQESIDCPVEGAENVEIAFNSAYVIDGLAASKEEELYFDVESPQKPGVFRSVGSTEYMYLIMPVRI